SLACLNKSRTREAPTPTNISTKSEPDKEKKGTCASPATAFASKVLPVPGGPTKSAPFGIFPPKSVYFFGFFRKSTISITSVLASSRPATSLKVMLICDSLSNSWALDFPILNKAPPPPAPPPLIRRIKNIQRATKITRGKIKVSKNPLHALFSSRQSIEIDGLPSGIASCAALRSSLNVISEPDVKIYCGSVDTVLNIDWFCTATSLYFSSVRRSG